MSKKPRTPPGTTVIATNRRALYDYDIVTTYEAGIALVGTEVKALREGQVTLGEAYVRINNGEAWLIGCHIPEYRYGNRFNHEPRRPRKLLLNAREIERITIKLREQGFSAVPLSLYFKNGWAKLEFGLGKGRKYIDKRNLEREKEARREIRDHLS